MSDCFKIQRAGDGWTLYVGSGGSCVALNFIEFHCFQSNHTIFIQPNYNVPNDLYFNFIKMESSILKDVCAEVTCLHTSGLRKVAVVALGQTAAVVVGGEVVNVGPTEQGRVSKSHCQAKSSAYSDDMYPSIVQGKIGRSYSFRPIFWIGFSNYSGIRESQQF